MSIATNPAGSPAETPVVTPTLPHAAPILGHALQFKREPLEFLRSVRPYGDVVVIKLGAKPAYVVNHHDLIRRILVHDVSKFARIRSPRRPAGWSSRCPVRPPPASRRRGRGWRASPVRPPGRAREPGRRGGLPPAPAAATGRRERPTSRSAGAAGTGAAGTGAAGTGAAGTGAAGTGAAGTGAAGTGAAGTGTDGDGARAGSLRSMVCWDICCSWERVRPGWAARPAPDTLLPGSRVLIRRISELRT